MINLQCYPLRSLFMLTLLPLAVINCGSENNNKRSSSPKNDATTHVGDGSESGTDSDSGTNNATGNNTGSSTGDNTAGGTGGTADTGSDNGTNTGTDTATGNGANSGNSGSGIDTGSGSGAGTDTGSGTDSTTCISGNAPTEWYLDNDNDTYGDSAVSVTACTAPTNYVASGGDCDDSNSTDAPNINPGATEVCDGFDNNCNGSVDEGVQQSTWYRDLDSDGYGDDANTVTACNAPANYVDIGGDCNDDSADSNAAGIYPGATEICDGLDNNCNDSVDEGLTKPTWYMDADGDGYGDDAITLVTCNAPANYVDMGRDCDDSANPASALIHPGAAEICDGKDNNCDNLIDNNLTFVDFFPDVDGDGYGDDTQVVSACVTPVGYVQTAGDCAPQDPFRHPGMTEVPGNGVDENCDGKELCLVDGDNDTVWDRASFGGQYALVYQHRVAGSSGTAAPQPDYAAMLKPFAVQTVYKTSLSSFNLSFDGNVTAAAAGFSVLYPLIIVDLPADLAATDLTPLASRLQTHIDRGGALIVSASNMANMPSLMALLGLTTSSTPFTGSLQTVANAAASYDIMSSHQLLPMLPGTTQVGLDESVNAYPAATTTVSFSADAQALAYYKGSTEPAIFSAFSGRVIVNMFGSLRHYQAPSGNGTDTVTDTRPNMDHNNDGEHDAYALFRNEFLAVNAGAANTGSFTLSSDLTCGAINMVNATLFGDCNDADAAINPAAVDLPFGNYDAQGFAIDTNCDGVSGNKKNALFVQPGRDLTNLIPDGKTDHPYGDIQTAVDAAATAGIPHVYVQTGNDPSINLTIPDGVSVFGGYNTTYQRQKTARTVITSDVSPVVTIANITSAGYFAGFSISAVAQPLIYVQSVIVPPTSARGIVLNNIANTFTVAENSVTTMDGSSGATGTFGGNPQQGTDGLPGSRPLASCSSTGGGAGSAVTVLLRGAGGAGGNTVSGGNSTAGTDGQAGGPCFIGSGCVGGGGGSGGGVKTDTTKTLLDCGPDPISAGQAGQNGADGITRTHAQTVATRQAYGEIIGNDWLALSGDAGMTGTDGKSGGGGGGGGACVGKYLKAAGGGGGSGGTGGDGGGGGGGGHGGSGSIAILAIDADSAVIRDNILLTGNGGAGGPGGKSALGQHGGIGGGRGFGGNCTGQVFGSNNRVQGGDGGGGGNGGRGGHGGAGSGGGGGMSACLLRVRSPQLTYSVSTGTAVNKNSCTFGNSGVAGAGGGYFGSSWTTVAIDGDAGLAGEDLSL